MPAWWGKKSSSAKNHQQDPSSSPHTSNKKSPRRSSNTINENNNNNSNTRPKSFDEKILIRPTNNINSSNEFSGFNSVGGGGGDERKGHPLPRPFAIDLGTSTATGGLGSGSVSVSSVSSSGSSDDNIHHHHQNHLLHLPPSRPSCEIKFNTRCTSPGPGPGSRSPTSAMSPLHPHLSLESPTGRQEEGGKSPCHRLPLPPGSPTSPSTSSSSSLPSSRKSGHTEIAPGALSKWKKGKLLGRGTFGHVYLGFNSESGQMCAIKEVKVVSDDRSSKECLKQLNQEINLLSQLSHPNIVQYYRSELSEETLSVYLEYVSGGSIYKLLQEYGAFKEPVIQNYTRQIVSGLAYLHGRKTVHRDIKGANILVDPNGEIKLADFGMAKHISACTSMLSFKGSPYWMAPEVVMNTNGYSLEVDIWSLGCTILEMATSKPPWSQYEGVAAIFKIGNSKDIPNIPDYLSNEAKSFVRLCLQRDPSVRPSSAQLLDHPFIRDQSTTRVANINITRDAFPHTFDGYRTPPPALTIQSNRSMPTCERDYVTTQGLMISRAPRSPRDNVRMITSLPVSPCSSPLRQYGPSYRSCFPSPPHPAYASVGKNSYNISDYSMQPTRPTTRHPIDHWEKGPLLKSSTPIGSPRR